ncbi:MAG TPA: EamA family transporter [Candidatus Saccharimonadia bacterium]
MTDWLIPALLAPMLWAFVVLIDDNLLRNVFRNAYFGGIAAGLFALIPLLILLVLPHTIPAWPVLVAAIAAGLATTCFYFLLFRSLELAEPSIVTAISMLATAFVPVMAWLVVGEQLGVYQLIGLAVLVVSSVAMSLLDARGFRPNRALYIMAGGSVLYAAAAVAMKYVYGEVDYRSGYLFFAAGMVLGGLFLMTATKPGRGFIATARGFSLNVWGFIVVGELLNVCAEALQGLAVSRGPVSLVRALEGLQPAWVLLIALILFPFWPRYFREAAGAHRGAKFACFAVIIVGVIMVAR